MSQSHVESLTLLKTADTTPVTNRFHPLPTALSRTRWRRREADPEAYTGRPHDLMRESTQFRSRRHRDGARDPLAGSRPTLTRASIRQQTSTSVSGRREGPLPRGLGSSMTRTTTHDDELGGERATLLEASSPIRARSPRRPARQLDLDLADRANVQDRDAEGSKGKDTEGITRAGLGSA